MSALLSQPDVMIPYIIIFLFSVVLHEVAHGYVAYRLGDDTAYLQGRLSLNPVKHIDPIWTILMPIITLFATGGKIMFGGAKPVPINPYRFRNMRKGMALTAIAGPLTNISIALILAATIWITVIAKNAMNLPLGSIEVALFRGMLINFLLAFFNLVPVPPLDGSRVLMWLLPREFAFQYSKLEPFGIVIVFALLYTGALQAIFYGAAYVSVLILPSGLIR